MNFSSRRTSNSKKKIYLDLCFKYYTTDKRDDFRTSQLVKAHNPEDKKLKREKSHL